MTRHHSCRVSPFGHPRIHARLAAPRGISQPPTSFIGSQCQGIHHAPLNTYNTKPKNESPTHTLPGACGYQKNLHYMKRSTHTRKPVHHLLMLATTIHKSNTTPHHQSRATTHRPRQRGATPTKRGTGLLSQSPIVCLMISHHNPGKPESRCST